MTRECFYENINSISELLDFCNEENIEIANNIYDYDSYQDWLNDRMLDYSRELTWHELRDWLNSIDDGWDYYFFDEYDEVSGIDDQLFLSLKDDVAREMDSYDSWDEPEAILEIEFDLDDSDFTSQSAEEEDFTTDNEPLSVFELFHSCNEVLSNINNC